MSLPSGTPLGPPGRSARRGCWRGGGCRGARWCGAWAGIDFVCLRCSGPAVFRVFAAALLRFSVATPRSSPARSRAAPPRCVRGGPRGSPAPRLPWLPVRGPLHPRGRCTHGRAGALPLWFARAGKAFSPRWCRPHPSFLSVEAPRPLRTVRFEKEA